MKREPYVSTADIVPNSSLPHWQDLLMVIIGCDDIEAVEGKCSLGNTYRGYTVETILEQIKRVGRPAVPREVHRALQHLCDKRFLKALLVRVKGDKARTILYWPVRLQPLKEVGPVKLLKKHSYVPEDK